MKNFNSELFEEFVASELRELESRDVDNLFDMIKENLQTAGFEFDAETDDELYSIIEKQVAVLKLDHWSSPNGCYRGCPACEFERKRGGK